MAVTRIREMEDTSSGTNKVEAWHRTLSRTQTNNHEHDCGIPHTYRTLQGTKNMKSLPCNIYMAARMYNFRSDITVYKPATTEIINIPVVPVVASTVIEGPKQLVIRKHKRRKTDTEAVLIRVYNDVCRMHRTFGSCISLYSMAAFTYPAVPLHGFLDRGFVARLQQSKEFTMHERQTIDGALQLLAQENGTSAMGNYSNVASLFSTVHLHSARSRSLQDSAFWFPSLY